MFLRYNLFGILWLLLITLLGLTPGESMPVTNIWDFFSFDKIAHFAVFAMLTLLLIIGFTKQYSFLFVRYHAINLGIGFALAYGIAIELLQLMIPERALEWQDMLANSIGVFVGWLVFYLIYKL